jgi:hypothetical protein
MSVQLTDVGVIPYQGMLAQATLPNKRPSHARKLAPVSKDRCWPRNGPEPAPESRRSTGRNDPKRAFG